MLKVSRDNGLRQRVVSKSQALRSDSCSSQKFPSSFKAGAIRPVAESYPSPGIGRDVRLEATTLSGSALVVDDQAVHLELFAESPTPHP